MRRKKIISILLGFITGGCGVAGYFIFSNLSAVNTIPPWGYLTFFPLYGLTAISIWITLTGELKFWHVPDSSKSKIRFFHPSVFFKETWFEVTKDANLATGKNIGYDVLIVAATTAFSLTLVEYFGDRATLSKIWPSATEGKYGELCVFAYWSFSRSFCYVAIPSVVMMLSPSMKFSRCGLQLKGFFDHLWIYGVLFLLVLPVIAFVSFKSDFKSYYPFYDHASRSWFDFLAWEALYAIQFVALEFLFRGFMLHPIKNHIGAYSIFAMIMPYCMIHYGKPYLEANAAIVAGIVLGTLSLKTGSIWCGALIHITVAVSMDIAALIQAGKLSNLLFHGSFI